MVIVTASMATLSACVVIYIDLSLGWIFIFTILSMRESHYRQGTIVVKYKRDECIQPTLIEHNVCMAKLCFILIDRQFPARPGFGINKDYDRQHIALG